MTAYEDRPAPARALQRAARRPVAPALRRAHRARSERRMGDARQSGQRRIVRRPNLRDMELGRGRPRRRAAKERFNEIATAAERPVDRSSATTCSTATKAWEHIVTERREVSARRSLRRTTARSLPTSYARSKDAEAAADSRTLAALVGLPGDATDSRELRRRGNCARMVYRAYVTRASTEGDCRTTTATSWLESSCFESEQAGAARLRLVRRHGR